MNAQGDKVMSTKDTKGIIFGMDFGKGESVTAVMKPMLYCPGCAKKMTILHRHEDSLGVQYMAYCRCCKSKWDITKQVSN